MDINQLKFNFAIYLRDIKGDEEIKYDPISDISIFQYAKEFKEFIKSQYSSNELNISSMSIGDILDLTIVNGKLVDPDKLAEEEQEATEEEQPEYNGETVENDIEQEQIPPAEGEETLNEGDKVNFDETSATDIFNTLMEDELFSSALDEDKNGEIDKGELYNFFTAISTYDGDSSNISIDDILSAAENIANNTSNSEIPNTNPSDNLFNNNSPSTNNTPKATEKREVSNPTASQSTPKATANREVSNPTASQSTPKATTPKPSESSSEKNIDNMTSQELESELTDANNDLAEKENNLESIQNGNDKVVAPLKEAMEKSLEDYTKALNDEGTKEATQLAEVTQQIEENETKQRENKEQKENYNNQIEIANKDIEHYDTVIQNCTDGISTLEGQISSLESQLNSIQENPDDPTAASEYKAYINVQIENAKAEQKKLEEEKQQAEASKTEAEEKLNNATEQLSNIEDTITLTDEELETLKTTQKELEATVFKQNPALEAMKQNYLEAKEIYTTTRENEINQAKDEVTQAQAYITEITNKLQEVRKNEYEQKFSVNEMSDFDSKNNFEKAIEWAKQFEGKSQNEMKKIFNEMGYQFHNKAWCGDFTRMVLFSQVGKDNLADWFTECPNLAYCPTIQQSAKGHEITNWEEAQAGDIVLFDWASDGRDGSADHVGIVIGYDPQTDTLITIEGNTSSSGISSCVAVKYRHRSDIIGIYNTHKS